MAAQTDCVDFSGVLRRLQHLDILQLHAGHIQTLCSEGQVITLLIRNVLQCRDAATMTTTQSQGICCCPGSLKNLVWTKVLQEILSGLYFANDVPISPLSVRLLKTNNMDSKWNLVEGCGWKHNYEYLISDNEASEGVFTCSLLRGGAGGSSGLSHRQMWPSSCLCPLTAPENTTVIRWWICWLSDCASD